MNKHQLLTHLKLFIVVIIGLFIFNTATYAQSCHFGGSWNTNFGKMTLSQSGRRVSGSMGGQKITGEVNGYIFQGSYWVGSYPADLTLYITPNCNGLQGEYASGANTYKMNATRLTHQPHAPSSSPPTQYVQRSGGYGLPTYTSNATTSYNWNGVWGTKSGNIKLKKTGSKTVEGTYTINSKSKGVTQGMIKATISGNQIVGFWSEGPTYTAPNDAGDFYFTMAPGSNSFTGQWRYGYQQHNRQWKPGNTWNGKRLSY